MAAAPRADDALAAPETKCEWCGRTFERPSGLPTHQKTCEKKPDGWEEPKPLRQRKRHCPKQKQPLELEVEKLQEQLNKANEEKEELRTQNQGLQTRLSQDMILQATFLLFLMILGFSGNSYWL